MSGAEIISSINIEGDYLVANSRYAALSFHLSELSLPLIEEIYRALEPDASAETIRKRSIDLLDEITANYPHILWSQKTPGADYRPAAIPAASVTAAAPPAATPLPEPPPQLEWLVGFIVSKTQREDVLGDLTEDFNTDLKAGMSVDRARLRYSTRACATIRDQLWPAVKRLGVWGMILKMFAS